jgi:NAD-reducing hydrogenase small subunit
LADQIELVYGPLVDIKEFPENVDVAIVEGAASSNEDIEKIREIRGRSKLLIALGDCAITGNVPAMRNTFGLDELFDRAYQENVDTTPQRPTTSLPVLMEHARPLHEFVKVDLFVPGCPPPADAIHHVLAELLAGRIPDPSTMTRFGK